ncbi:MAG: hypothetical protein QG597_4358, partial [Actinomycetota bacterium]|nr:hypothetical protein [Actinomycetota bacterium]
MSAGHQPTGPESGRVEFSGSSVARVIITVEGAGVGKVAAVTADRGRQVRPDSWWSPPWQPGGPDDPDRDVGMPPPSARGRSTTQPAAPATHADEGQTRSVERVRDLAEVFTHRREVDAMLDLIPDSFD